jgi:hypothetical protein
VQPIASDPDGDALIFSLDTNAPPGIVIEPYTGRITWVTGAGSGSSVNLLTVQVLDSGSPRLGTVRTFQVTVRDVNTAPVLEPISNRIVAVDQQLVITNRASDADLPSQTLRFSLGPGAPSGAILGATNGVFSWQPRAVDASTTNLISIIVTDSGTPSLSATQTFRVVVRDTRGHLVVGLGTTNRLAGQSGSVSLVVTAGADLTRFTGELLVPDAHLQNLELVPTDQEVIAAFLNPLGAGPYRIQVDLDPTWARSGERTVAQLRFDTRPVGRSAVAAFVIRDLDGARLGGAPVVMTTARLGRVFVIEQEPLLDASLAASRDAISLVVYGEPGVSYRLQRAPNLHPNAVWTDDELVSLSGTFSVLPRALAPEPVAYFRVLPLSTPGGPRLTATRDLAGTVTLSWALPSDGWIMEEATTLAGSPAAWGPTTAAYQTNAMQIQVTVSSSSGSRFYRLHKP